MMEAVFDESAGGSLKQAMSFGRGPCRDTGLIGFLFEAGAPPPEELEKLKRREEERFRRAWEEAVPLGGTPADVFCFALGLSTGDLSRLQPPGQLEALQKRFAAGEPLRVWYSDQPEERCGLYWLMDQLSGLEGPISSVKLPEFEVQGNAVIRRTGCGELAPGEWHRLLPLEQPLPDPLRRHYAAAWKRLREENAPLRAVLNGELYSVPENLYDGYIFRELAAAGPEFHESGAIGAVVGKYQLRISDMWIHGRIEKLVQSGALAVVSGPEREDGIPYRRILRKMHEFYSNHQNC